MDRRIELIRKMDAWQLKHLSLSFVFAIRAEDSDGLVISEVDWQNRCLNFGSRFSGSDFNKGVVSFHLPFPLELARIVRACVAGRAEGPLLRTRTVCEGNESRKLHVGSADDLVRLIKDAFSSARQDEVQSAQDQKRIVRKTLRKMGGLRQGELRREFKRLLKAADINTDGRYYDVKGSVTTDMNSAGLSHLMLRYVTGHTTRDILNEYVSLDCEKEMQNYFDYIQPLLTAIMTRADELGLPRIG
ncbi:MAG: hypothetical protein DWQ35_21710 [Planctomycetota bacterium]|nr:MAG: hypothetical protein DWQ35_21710 [Planctomycetota bacterium]REK31619.1 MAG: hypothetical protein DWQ42_00015 [Planctomycetota bacterium]REK42378.1 MAG: hypothetical protein DWQ46_13630 [Planctomycetota bacterium]